MKKTLLLLGSMFLLWQGIGAAAYAESYAPETSFLIPCKVEGMKSPSLLLNGDWQFRFSPKGKWNTVKVPGELAMQGYAIQHDTPYLYKKSFVLPSDYQDKQVILRFDGVYGQAVLTVNGKQVREHHGGFTRWETDVTELVHPGKKNEIQLEITDRVDDISYASGYAHHPIGGILRDVTIFALPKDCFYDFVVETQLDAQYRDAVLKVSYTGKASDKTEVAYALTDPSGRQVSLSQSVFKMKRQDNINELPVSAPLKWDAEHPNLYTLAITLREEGKEVSHFTKKIGFREVKIVKDRMLVNGKPVKLRGACRHDIHPELGRTTTAELDSLDAIRFKQANMNFVRTSHYPPTERFLDFCDRYGIYVECETAVCFVNTHRQKNYAPAATQDSMEFAPLYLSQCREMVKSFRSHSSILFWSIGNESIYGKNFQACWDWVKQTDTTRPVIFSYPGSVGDREPIYDILSMHYQDVDGNLNQWGRVTHNFQGHGIPAIFDEWAHPACYTYKTLQDDPNIREFWGISLDKMWSGLFDAPGGLGGAIWGYIDETFMLPEPKLGISFWKEFAHTAKPEGFRGNCVGYGEWGIVDVWRREKPEFWATKKAYSPVRLLTEQISDYTSGERLALPVYNRFDHTNLNEIKVRYQYKGIEKEIPAIAVEPHQKGLLLIPAEAWKESDELLISFLTKEGDLIDASLVTLGKPKITLPQPNRKGTLSVEETADRILVKGDHFEIPFLKESGLISHATADGQVFIEKGPFLNLDINLNHLTGAEVRKSATQFLTSDTDWQKQSLTYTKQGDRVVVILNGHYKEVATEIRLLISPEGRMEINYRVDGQPNGYLRETGLSFYLPETIDRLKWKRRGHWSYYLPGAFAGNEGETSLYNPNKVSYGTRPEQPWQLDTHNYYYWSDAGANCDRPLTQMAKGMKENIYFYTLDASQTGKGLSVLSSNATVACRSSKRADGQLILYVNNRWDYPEIAWGNYCKTLEATPCYGKIEIIF